MCQIGPKSLVFLILWNQRAGRRDWRVFFAEWLKVSNLSTAVGKPWPRSKSKGASMVSSKTSKAERTIVVYRGKANRAGPPRAGVLTETTTPR